jgi:hypothetical protein
MDWSKQTHLTALEFSNDGKWLLSADNLGFIKVKNNILHMLMISCEGLGSGFGNAARCNALYESMHWPSIQ